MVWKIIKDFKSCDFRFAKIFAFSGKYIMRIYGKLKMSFPALSEGNEKATQFSERMQTAKYPVGRTAFRVSALLEVEMPKCASPKRGTKNRDILLPIFTAF